MAELQCLGEADVCSNKTYRDHYCRNGGTCCESFGDVYCICPENTYGKRCDPGYSSPAHMSSVVDALAIFSILVIILVAVLLLLIGFMIIRWRREQLKLCCKLTPSDSSQNLPRKKQIMRKLPASRQPGLSWRQTTCRKYLSKNLSNSFSDMSRHTAIYTDRKTMASEERSARPSKSAMSAMRGDTEAALVASEKPTCVDSVEQVIVNLSDECNLVLV